MGRTLLQMWGDGRERGDFRQHKEGGLTRIRPGRDQKGIDDAATT